MGDVGVVHLWIVDCRLEARVPRGVASQAAFALLEVAWRSEIRQAGHWQLLLGQGLPRPCLMVFFSGNFMKNRVLKPSCL